jgi:hypothetical protein
MNHPSDEVVFEPKASLPFQMAIQMTTNVNRTLTISGWSKNNQKLAIMATLTTKLTAYMTLPKGVSSFMLK